MGSTTVAMMVKTRMKAMNDSFKLINILLNVEKVTIDSKTHDVFTEKQTKS
jgi:hypothetical protein